MRNFQGPPSANFISSQSHSANYAPSISFSSLEYVTDTSWYADNGATTHVTPDQSQLNNCSPYTCINSLIVGNGQSLPISCVGSAQVTSTPSKLKSHNTLCVPHIKKNLISISQLAKDNNVVIEFINSNCLVKEF
ncbi:hypothetical protein Scep_004504 [Stephania cephalantha]|uniref:Retrovirus-related Pol polyprotein from transposon TNT 1-94-like beta-barrel domain-containing protein n=1 Tax=Stephania cephalantha TaxID=152367 RepID=A0AAP0PWQ2_9MAGN